MKVLKLNHAEAEKIVAGERTSTIRLFDDKDIRVNDEIELLDKVDPHDRSSWRPIGIAKVTAVLEKLFGQLSIEDLKSESFGLTLRDAEKRLKSYYGEGITTETPIKFIQFEFTPVKMQMDNLVDKTTTPTTEVKLFADGGSRGNPGPSAAGYVLYDLDDTILVREGVYLGITTNNQAEYLALKLGLEMAQKRGARIVRVYLDSLLVVNQMTGKFKVKNRDLWPIHETIKDLVSKFERVQFTHVPRELNKEADAAVNEAMDAELKKQNTI